MFSLILAPYIIALFTAFFLVGDKNRKAMKVGKWLLIASVIIIVIADTILPKIMSGLNISGMIVLAVTFTLTPIGVGLLIGGQVKAFKVEGKRHQAAMTGVLSLALPLGIFLPIGYQVYKGVKAENDTLYTYQSLTINDRLGSQAIYIPI